MPLGEQLRALPAKPGVYLFKDSQGIVLYVGKAASLHHRVRSYFAPSADLSPKHHKLVARVADVDFMVTDSEPEAIILEGNLIKRYRPHYNVRLKDDKSYPYLKIDLSEEWPRIYITRRWEQDSARYFGPFASARSVRVTLDVLKILFPFR
ncbi:MAG: GIY-YIG nuclease family protein [Chloroflexota bacterium]